MGLFGYDRKHGMPGMTLHEKEKEWEIGPAKWSYPKKDDRWHPMDEEPTKEKVYQLRTTEKIRKDVGHKWGFSKFQDGNWLSTDWKTAANAEKAMSISHWVAAGWFDGWREIPDDPPVD